MKNSNQEIRKIIERNKRVELDKKWEISFTRTVFIIVLTFIGTFIFLKIIEGENPFWGSSLATGAYLLSTFSFNPIRKIWEKRRKE